MLFNTIEFGVFLPTVFAIYWMIPGHRNVFRNILILVASYIFYGWWDPRFLSLIFISTLVDFMIGKQLGVTENEKVRKRLLWASLSVNLGFLGFFKYFNFFVESFRDAFSLFGQTFDSWTLNIILPIGISFYTFQTLSYTIDVYKKKPEDAVGLVEKPTDYEVLPSFLDYISENYDLSNVVFIFRPDVDPKFILVCQEKGLKVFSIQHDGDYKSWSFETDNHWSCVSHEKASKQVSKFLEEYQF